MSKTLRTLLVAAGIALSGIASASTESMQFGTCAVRVDQYFKSLPNENPERARIGREVGIFMGTNKWFSGQDAADWNEGYSIGQAKKNPDLKGHYDHCVNMYNKRR